MAGLLLGLKDPPLCIHCSVFTERTRSPPFLSAGFGVSQSSLGHGDDSEKLERGSTELASDACAFYLGMD